MTSTSPDHKTRGRKNKGNINMDMYFTSDSLASTELASRSNRTCFKKFTKFVFRKGERQVYITVKFEEVIFKNTDYHGEFSTYAALVVLRKRTVNE